MLNLNVPYTERVILVLTDELKKKLYFKKSEIRIAVILEVS